jgi:hypothetical protein
MLKYIKHHMDSIDGISIYPVLSLLIFTLFFAGLLIYTFRLDRSFISKMKNQPFGEDDLNQN